MATRITYHQINVCPSSPTADGSDSVIIPHVENGWCQCVGAEFAGGGSGKRFLLHVVVFEPVPESEGRDGTQTEQTPN